MTSGETTDAAVKSTASELVEDGRAKVNLTLRVVGRRVDGYHDLESVVAFADCADQLSLLPGRELGLKAEFVCAVDGRALSGADRSQYDSRLARLNYRSEMTDAEIACPDPNCPTRLRITRTGRRYFKRTDVTAVER